MTDKELDLLRELFSKAGDIGSQGFDAMVRYTFASGLAWSIGATIALLVSLVAILTALLKDFGDDEINGCLFIGGAIVGLISLLVGISNLVDVIEPAGATVKVLLATAAK